MTPQESEINDFHRGRRTVRLNNRLEKWLSAYAAAAAAAGVGLLALTQSAEAKIVYTPASIDIPVNGSILLDLNHDGTADFSFVNKQWAYDEGEFVLLLGAGAKNPSNAIWGKGAFSSSFMNFRGPFASALRRGFTVGPKKSYFQKSANWLLAQNGGWFYSTASAGQWLFTHRRYLGLRFMINGQMHYGWARLSAILVDPTPIGFGIQATLTGYAYETIPNKPIITGKTKGPDVITLAPASLGHLAQGASGISVWREKK